MDISPNSHIQGPAENTLTTDPGLTTQAQDCTTGMNTPTQQGVPLADSTATTVAVKGLSSSSPDSAIAYQAPSDRTDKHIHADKDQSPDPVTTSQQKAPDGEVTGDLSGQVNKSPTGHAESSAVEQSAWVCVGGRKVHARDAKCNGVRAHDAEGTAVPTPEVKDSEAAHADAEKDSPSNNQPHTSPQAQAQAHQVYRGQGETTGPTEIQTQALRCAALSAEGRSSEAETTQNGGSMTREKESESESEGKAKRLSLTGPLNPNAKEFSGATRFMSSGKDGQGCATATADNNAIATADNNAIATADDSAIATDDNNATDVIDVDTIDCETTTAAHNLISEVTGHAGYNKPSAKQSDSQDMPHKPPTGHNSHHNPSHSHSHKKEKGARGGRGGHRGQQANANGHTKQSKGRHGGGGGGSYRDKEQYQRRSHFRLTDESNDDLGQYGDDVILDTFDGNHGNQTNRKGLANQMSLNHLLRFSYGDVPNARAGRYGRRQQNSTHSEKNAVFKKGQYMQANCQFVLRDSCGVLNQHLRNPDKEVDWRNVEEVRMFFTASENMLCPICLSPPSPAKTTPCGHVYCYGCVLHYLHMSAGAWSECPICHEPICAAELRSMTPVEHPSVEVHTPIDMRLLVKQGRSCIYPTPVDVAVTTNSTHIQIPHRCIWSWIKNRIVPKDERRNDYMANGDGGSHGTEEDNIEDTLPVEMYTPHPEWLDSADRVCLVWGQGSDGQLGIGDCVGYTTPQVLLSMIDRPLMNVSAGHSHTVAIGELADEEGSGHGVLMSWGSNMYGQTAKELDHFSFSTGFGGPEDDDDEDEQSVPLLVPSLNGFRFNDCATGLYHTLALGVSRAVGEDSSDDERGSLDGHSREYNRQHTKVFAWGSALLGDGTSNFESRPTHIRNLDDKQIDCVFAGGHHSMAISHSTGSVYLWGWLFERDVRENEKAVLRQIPSPVQLNAFNGMSVRTVACGVWHSSVVTTEGKVFTIGLQKPSNLLSRQIDLSYSSPFYASDEVKANVDVVNELDLQDQYDEEVTPSTAQSFPLASQLSATLMSGVPAIAACACGDGFTVMLSDGGEIYFSGLNKNIGASRLEAIKVEVNSTSPVKSISAGLNFYTAVTAAGDVYVQGLLHGRVYRSLSKVITAKAITHTATGNDFCIAYTRE